MRLITSVLSFVLRKLGLLGALVLTLFLSYLLIQAFVPALRQAEADRDRLNQVVEDRVKLQKDLEQLRSAAEKAQTTAITTQEKEVKTEIEKRRRNALDKTAEIKRLRSHQQEVCGIVGKVLSKVFPSNACAAAELAVKEANETLDTIETGLSQVEKKAAVLADPALSPAQKLDRLGKGGDQSPTQRDINDKQSELEQKTAEEESLRETQNSAVGWVVNGWARSWKLLTAIAVSALIVPVALRFIAYFLFMPLVSRIHKPLNLAAGSENADVGSPHHRCPADHDDPPWRR